MTVLDDAYRALARVPPGASGALARKRSDGHMVGAVLVEHGRICWAFSNQGPRRLTDLLVEVSGTLTDEQVNAVVAECRRDNTRLGETLVARGMISLDVLYTALLHHTCESLILLCGADGQWAWVEHGGRGYDPLLTFAMPEIMAALAAIVVPERSADAAQRLVEVLAPGLSGFAAERAHGPWRLLAQQACESLDLMTLGDIARRAADIVAVTETSTLRVAVVECSDQSFATWSEENAFFVLISCGDLSFNQLASRVSQLYESAGAEESAAPIEPMGEANIRAAARGGEAPATARS